MRRRFKKKNYKLYAFFIAIFTLALGYALMSSDLDILGTAGINKNTWDIHWDEDSIKDKSNVAVTTPAFVSDNEKLTISFDVKLGVPGDYYEFTANAKNYGTVDGKVKIVTLSFVDPVTKKPVKEEDLPDYMIYSLTHDDGMPIIEDEFIAAKASIKYKFRVEFDPELEDLPEIEDTHLPQPVIEIVTEQSKPDDPTKPYKITFYPNGGTVDPTTKDVVRGETIGELPIPTKGTTPFLGWYENKPEAIKITESYIPTSNMLLVARWADSYTIFDTGTNVNVKLKTLVGDTINENYPTSTQNTSVTAITKSNTAPEEGTTTTNIAAEGCEPILAWYSNGTIYWYTAAEEVYLNQDASYMFTWFKNAASIDTSFITSNTTNMAGMFSSAGATSLDLSNFDTSKVTNMSTMFAGLPATSLNLSSFDTSNVTDMSTMFASSNVTSLDLSSFNTSSVTNMSAMFASSNSTSIDVSSFNTSSVTNMASMFSGSKVNTINLSNFNIDNVENMGGIFSSSSVTSINISGWNFNKVTSIGGLFSGLTNLETLNLTNVNTSKVTNFNGLFYGCIKLEELDLSSFDTKLVTDMTNMFNSCISLVTVTVSDDFVVDQVTSDNNMFSGAISIVGGKGTTYDSSHIDKLYARYDRGTKRPGYFNKANLQTYRVTFNANGGTVSPSYIDVEEEDEIGNLPVPTREGYGFNGWFIDLQLGTELTKDYVPTGNIEVTADWKENKSVTFDSNGGEFENSETTNSINYTYHYVNGTAYSHTANIDDTGVAAGTYSSNTETNDIVTIQGATQLQIEVWFSTESDNYDWLAIYPAGVTPTSSNSAQATISNGKLYGGYLTSKPSDDSNYHKTFTVDGDTAQFYFKSDSGGNYYGYYAIITANARGYITSDTYKEPEKAEAEFLGWNTAQDGTGTTYATKEAVEENLSSLSTPITLYAKWNNKPRHTITYDANQGTFDNNQTTNEMLYKYGNVTGTRYSHTANIDDSGVASSTYASNLDSYEVVTIPGATQLNIEVWFTTESEYYDWLAIYPAGVTPSDSNSSEATISGGKLAGRGSYSGYTKPNDNDTTYHRTFTVNGNTAQFYFKSDSGGNYYGYYAIVTGTGRGYSSEDTYKVPTKNEYLFTGWNTAQNGTGTTYTSEEDVINHMDDIGTTATLYAKWYQLQKYTITYDADGGTVDPTSVEVLEGNAIGQLPTPTKTKAQFLGWFTSNNVQVDSTYQPTASETLTAHWRNIYTVTYNANGGTVSPASVDVLAGNTIGTLPTPEKGNDIFLGWYLDLQIGDKITTSYQPNSDIELFAKWGSCGNFATESWSTINANMNNDSNAYSIGCTKDVDLGTLGTHKVRIINTTTPSVCSNSGYSETACGIVLEFEDILVTSQMNSTNTTSGGFPNTIIYNTYLKENATNSLYSYLPQELKDIIIETKVVSGYGSGEGSNYVQNGEKLFLLNQREIFNSASVDTSNGYTRQEDYYSNKGVTTSYNISVAKKLYNNTYTDYWNRSPGNSTTFRYVQTTGSPSGTGASNTKGVSPAFRISNTYTVTFNPNGGTVSPTTKFVAKNGTLGSTPVPEKTGDIFKGWYTEIGGGIKVDSNTVINGNVTYYADWASSREIPNPDPSDPPEDEGKSFVPDTPLPTDPEDPDKEIISIADKICFNTIKTECFYVIDTNDTTTTLIAMNNLNVGPNANPNETKTDLDTGLPYLSLGLQGAGNRYRVPFAASNSWDSGYAWDPQLTYPADIYGPNVSISQYVNAYVAKLKSFGAPPSTTGRLITREEIENYECRQVNASGKCPVAYNRILGIEDRKFWLGTAELFDSIYTSDMCTKPNGDLDYCDEQYNEVLYGVRPVIEIPTSAINTSDPVNP